MPQAAPISPREVSAELLPKLLEKARLSHRNNRLLEAAEGYRQILEIQPDSQLALLGLSLVARQSQQYEAAARMAEAAISYCPPHSAEAALASAHLGHSLFALRRFEDAEEAFRQAFDAIDLKAFSFGPEAVGLQPEIRAIEEPALNPHPVIDKLAVAKLARIEGHVGLGELFAASNRTLEAIPHFKSAIILSPLLAAAHYGLGSALAQREDFAAALPTFEVAARLAPASHLAFFALGFSRARMGQHGLAVEAYREALEKRPQFASAWLNLGVELIADGREQLASPCYRQAIAVLPNPEQADDPALQTHISAHLNLGHLERGRKNFSQAETEYALALKLASDQKACTAARRSEIFVAFAYLHLEQENLALAWQALDQAEKFACSLIHGAQVYRAQVQSVPLAGAVIEEKTLLPNPEIPNARGIVLLAKHSTRNSSGSTREVLNTAPESLDEMDQPGQPNELNEAGKMCEVDELHQAIQAFQQAETLGHKTAASNRGNALLRLGLCAEALKAHRTALDLDPHHPGVRYNLALTQLRMGDFLHGWQNYEIRWSFREVHPRPRRFAQPWWLGEVLCHQASGPTVPILLVYSEQGLGDTIQFLRFLPLAARRILGQGEPPDRASVSAWILFEVQPSLARLLAPYMEELEASHAGLRTRLISHGEALPPFTHHCPLLSMPAIFRTDVDSIPWSPSPGKMGYLQADPSLVQIRASEIESVQCLRESGDDPITPGESKLASRRRIGIAWAGNPKYRADRERSTHLRTFGPLLARDEFTWFSLQKGDAAAQIQELPAHLRPQDSSSSDRDLADTAALIENLDLVITTDTVIAHLAGALGKPLWLLLPWQSDWRWMQNTLHSPWYPTARLFRQASPAAWRDLVERVAEELKTVASNPACDKTESPAVAQKYS